MSQDLSILIKTILDKTSKTNITTEITTLVSELQKKIGTLNIKIGGTGLSQLISQLNQISSFMQNIKIPRFNFDAPTKESLKFLTAIGSIENTLNATGRTAKSTWDEFGRVTVNVTNTSKGLVENFKYQWDAVNQSLVRVNRQQQDNMLSIDQLQAKYKGMVNTLQNGKLGQFINTNELKSFENILNNIKVVDGKITTELQAQFNKIKQNTQARKDELNLVNNLDKKQADLLAKIDRMKSTYGNAVFNQFKATGMNKLISDIKLVTKDTNNLSSVFNNLEQRLNKLDLKMSSLSKIKTQVGKIEGFNTKYTDKFNELKINAIVNPSSISKIEKQFLSLQEKMKNALSNGDTKAFDRYAISIARLKRNVDGLFNTQKQLQTKSNSNLDEEIRAYRIKNQEAANFLRNQQKIELTQKDAIINVTKLKQQYAGLYDNSKLNAYLNSINKLNPASKNLTHQIQLLNREFNSIKADAISKGFNNANKSAISFAESIKLITYKFSTWLIVGNALMGFYRQFGEGVKFIKDLDTAMISLKKVTDETEMTYQRLASTASRIGNIFARTTTEVVDAITNFSKMGYSLRDATELAKTSLITSNVGDIQDMNTASMYLIANLKAYNIEAKDSIKIIDVLNNLQNKHATTVEVLGEGLKRTANSMQLAGASMEQTASMITAVQAVSQRGGEVIGNSLRTIAMRIRGVDGDTGELIPTLDKDLEQVGVRLKTVDGEFRNVYEVLKDLSVVYNSGKLDSITSADLLEKIAGKRQGEILATLLSNFAESEEALKHALDSSGSAMQENEKYMDSVNAKIKQLRVSMETLYSTFLSSDTLLGFINIANNLVNAFSSVSSHIGGINTLFLIFGTTLLLTSTKVRAFSTTLNVGIINAFGLSIFNLHARLMLLTKSAMATRIAISALQGVMSLGIGLAIGFAIEGVLKLVAAYGEAKKKQKEYFNELSSSAKSVQQDINSNKDLISVYEELSNKTNLNSQEKNKLLDITNKLAQAIPNAVAQYDLEGNAISLNREELQKYIDLKEQELKYKREDLKTLFYANVDTEVASLREKRKRLNEVTEEMKLQQSIIEKESNKKNGNGRYIKSAQSVYEDLRTEQQTLQTDMGELTSKVKSQSEAFLILNDNIKDLSKTDVTKIINLLFDSIDNLGDKSFKGLFQSFISDKNITNSIRNINSAIEEYKKGNVSAEATQKKVNEQLSNLKSILINLGAEPQKVKDFIDSFKPENIKVTTDELNNFDIKVKQLQETLSNSVSTISKINKVLIDYNENNKFNIDTIIELAKEHNQLLSLLDDEKALRDELINIVNKEQEKAKQAYIEKITLDKDFYENKILNNKNFISLMEKYQIKELNNFKNLTEAKQKVEESLINKISEKWAKFYDAQGKLQSEKYEFKMNPKTKELYLADAKTGAFISDDKEFFKEYGEIQKRNADLAGSFRKITEESSGVDFSKIGLDGADALGVKSSDKETNPVTNLISKYTVEQEKIDALLEKSKAIQETLIPSSAEYRKETEEQIKLLKDKQNSIHDENVALTNLSKTTQLTTEQKNQLEKESAKNSTEWYKIQKDIYEGSDKMMANTLSEFTSQLTELDNKQQFINNTASKYSKSSQAYRDSIQLEIDIIKEKNNVLHQANEFIREQIASGKLTAQQAEEYRKQLQPNSNTYASNIGDIDTKNLDILKSKYEELDIPIQQITDRLSMLQTVQSLYDEGSQQYVDNTQQQINVNKELISALQAKHKAIEADLALAEKGTATYDELSNMLSDVIKAELDAVQKKKEFIKNITDDTIDLMKEVYEKEKDIAIDALDAQIEKEEERHDKIIKNLEDEMDEYEDSINKKKQLMDRLYNTEDYDSEMSKLNKEKLEIQKQIDYLGKNDSYEGKQLKAELQKELDAKNEEILNSQRDREKELREDNLDDLLDEYKDENDAKKELEDDKYDSTKKSLEKQKKETERYYQDMIANEIKFNNLKEDLASGNVDNIIQELQRLINFVGENEDSFGAGLGETLTSNLQNKIDLISKNVGNDSSGSGSGSGSNNSSQTPKAVITPSQYINENGTAIIKSRSLASILGEDVEWDQSTGRVKIGSKWFVPYRNDNGTTYLKLRETVESLGRTVKYDDITKNISIFHEGGVVGNSSNRIADLIDNLFNKGIKSNELPSLLQNEEVVLSKNAVSNFIPNMQSIISKFTPNINIPSFSPVGATSGGNTNYYLSVNVDNMNANSQKDIESVSNKLLNLIRKSGKQIQ